MVEHAAKADIECGAGHVAGAWNAAVYVCEARPGVCEI